MSITHFLIATTCPSRQRDIKAEVIAACVASSDDMALVVDQVLNVKQLRDVIDQIELNLRFAVILVGTPKETSEHSQEILNWRPDFVVLQVELAGPDVRIDLRDPGLKVLAALRDLVEHIGNDRTGVVRIEPSSEPSSEVANKVSDRNPDQPPSAAANQGQLLAASVNWLNAVLRNELLKESDNGDEVLGMSIPRDAILRSFDQIYEPNVDEQEAASALADILRHSSLDEPLKVIHVHLGLSQIEFKLLLLVLAPDLDIRFQRCYGFLQDDLSRRHGSLGFYCSLLGDALDVRLQLRLADAIVRWRLLDVLAPSADEMLRLDSHLVQWILGDSKALIRDPRVARVIKKEPWLGAALIDRKKERAIADSLVKWLKLITRGGWRLLTGNQAASWKAILEYGCASGEIIRVDAIQLREMDTTECEEVATRIGRAGILTGWPIVIDASDTNSLGPALAAFSSVFNRLGIRAAIICSQAATIVDYLGEAKVQLASTQVFSAAAKNAVAKAAFRLAETSATDEDALALFSRFPLTVDRLEVAARMARAEVSPELSKEELHSNFLKACQQVATAGLSRLSESIDTNIQLSQVILPDDRSSQLQEIVDQVNFSDQVLDRWKFGSQLPYGKGVSALFFGPSGTGKTMAAMGIANKLRVPLLKLDLSRVVSKYIGETEKNINQVFEDAESSGGAILIDEADALLGKRSEVKDAHDRYANIEVAYLLQRMESFTGLAILTTNMRQNLDSAFVRRLRFIIEFPKPSVEAREKIWRICLPEESHVLQDSAFKHLAKRVDLTGGHIRQITLRAAFLAASEGEQIHMNHIATACRAEFIKLGMPSIELDIKLDRRVA